METSLSENEIRNFYLLENAQIKNSISIRELKEYTISRIKLHRDIDQE